MTRPPLPPVADQGFMFSRLRVSWLIASVVLGANSFHAESAAAQSAADKATARQLATEGIRLFQKEKYGDALDKLERAESLFDAPVHLLYIARCQARLDRYVEAAEAYRKLVRVELPAQAPQTFKDAVADGQKELAELEPKIPVLRLELTPEHVRDVRLTIDGEAVSSAVIGADRPMNPGSHLVEVAAKGHASVSRKVEITASSKQVLKLELAPSEAQPAEAPHASSATDGSLNTPAAGAGGSTPGGASSDGKTPSMAPQQPARRLTIIGGLDLDGVLPISGKIDKQAGTGSADTRDITDRYGAGGGLELRAGLAIPVASFALTPLLFVNAQSHAPGQLYKSPANQAYESLDGSVDSVMTAHPMSTAVGFGLRFGSLPKAPFEIGGFGELDAVIRQSYETTATWKVSSPGREGQCEFTEEFSGFGTRLRGGVTMAVSRLVTLVGSAGFTVANVSSAGMTKRTCTGGYTLDAADKATVPSGQRSFHSVFGLGLGAEFGFGL